MIGSVVYFAGQLLIFHTIRSFGAVVFAIIMTVRIALSILASCFIYHHKINELGALGLVIVFCAVAFRIQVRQIHYTRAFAVLICTALYIAF
jgi:drug/metabolite transporter (DMT)-like permease